MLRPSALVPGLYARRRTALPTAAFAILFLAVLIAVLPLGTLLVVIGGSILAAAVLLWPDTAFYLLIVAVPFGSLMPLPFAGANITAADGLLLVALAVWLARGIARRQILVRPASLLLPFIVFLIAAGLSVTGALSLQASAKELYKWVEMLAVYWLLVQTASPLRTAGPAWHGKEQAAPRARHFPANAWESEGGRIKLLLSVIFLAGLAEALVGFYQYFLQVGPEGFILGGGSLRAYGTFDQPNPYAGYLGLVIPLAFGVILGSITLGRKLLSPSALALAALACLSAAAMLLALVFSMSRGALLGVASALAVVVVIRSRRAAALAIAAALLVAIVALLGQLNVIPDVVTARFAGVSDYINLQDMRDVKVTDANYAIVERMAHWQAGLDMFQAHPWLGVGIGNYAVVYPGYSLPHWDDPLGHAHNYYINILAEAGGVGLAGYLVLWGAIFWLAWRTVRETRGLAQGVAAGAAGVLVALSVHNLFDNLFVHSMQMQVGLTLGLIELLRGRGVYL